MKQLGWNKKFLIDGFPRNDENYTVWFDLLGSKTDFLFCINLECDFDVLEKRILERNRGEDDKIEILKIRF